MREKQQESEDRKWAAIDLTVERKGNKIILPASPTPMGYRSAIKTLMRLAEEEETEYAISERINGHFYDGLVAMALAIKDIYGAVKGLRTPGFFTSHPPRFIPVHVGPNGETVEVPWGRMEIPNVEGYIETGYTEVRGIPHLSITGTILKRDREVVMNIIRRANEFIKSNSIYRGAAIILEHGKEGKIDFEDQIQFFDPHVGGEMPIFSKAVDDMIDDNILTPIRKTAQCRSLGIPLKRNILMAGPYGCGKSLTARQVAREATMNGWTFINCTSAQSLQSALRFAKMYQPCVLFAEDIDRITEERNEGANDLINTIDGVVGKNDEIMIVLTTNFAEKIEKAMLRPGRLDAVIDITPPDAEAVERLIKFYAKETLDGDADISEACAMLEGKIPAVIRETVERSRLSMLNHDREKIVGSDLVVAARTMDNHLRLIDRASEGVKERPSIETAIAATVKPLIDEALLKIEDMV